MPGGTSIVSCGLSPSSSAIFVTSTWKLIWFSLASTRVLSSEGRVLVLWCVCVGVCVCGWVCGDVCGCGCKCVGIRVGEDL